MPGAPAPGITNRRLGLVRAPAFGVVLAGLLGVRDGGDSGANLHLAVWPLDRRLRRPAVRLAPDQGHLGAHRDGRVDDAKRQLLALVVAVAAEQRQAHDLPVKENAVVVRRSTRLNSSHVEISYAVFCLK